MPYAPANTRFTLDDSQLRDFDRRLSRVGRVFDRRTADRVLRFAARPVVPVMRANAPVGPAITFKSSVRTRGARKGTPRPAYEMRRGGATRQDVRIRSVDGRGNESARVLVGVSRKWGKVGYRTHLITRRNLHNRNPNDFIGKTERQTEGVVERGFADAAEKVVTKILGV